MAILPEIYNRTIYFDDPSHKYTDNLGNEYTSTTTIIHKYEIPFDTKANARRLAKEGRGQYEGKTAKQIEAMWTEITEEACAKGTMKHDNLEQNVKQHSKFRAAIKPLKGNTLYTIDDIVKQELNCKLDIVAFTTSLGDRYPKIVKLVEWYVNNGYVLYAEVGVYDPKHLISGMIDLLAIKDDDFVILDWKTNKDEIKFESGYYKRDKDRQNTNDWVTQHKYLKYPIDNLPDCNGSIYAMQLNVYAKMLIDRGFRCVGIVLIQIRDTYVLNQYGMPKTNNKGQYEVVADMPETVTVIVMPQYQDEVNRIFKHHKDTTLKSGIQNKLIF